MNIFMVNFLLFSSFSKTNSKYFTKKKKKWTSAIYEDKCYDFEGDAS